MVARDRNHPCVVVWSLGNEGGEGRNFAAMAAAMRRLDPCRRPVQYESCGALPYTDIVCPMYPSVAKLESMATAEGQCLTYKANGRRYPPADPAVVGRRPVVMCEYQHSMGNSTGNFHHYWQAIDRHDCLQGGFVWDWCDQGLDMRLMKAPAIAEGEGSSRSEAAPAPADEHARASAWGYGGDFGEVMHDSQFNINGIVWPDRRPHPAAFEIQHVQQPVRLELADWRWTPVEPAAAARGRGHLVGKGQVRVVNRHDFISLAHLEALATVSVRGVERPVQDFGRLSLGPGQAAEVDVAASLALPSLPLALLRARLAGGALHLNVRLELARDQSWAAKGHVVAWDQFVLVAPTVHELGGDVPPAGDPWPPPAARPVEMQRTSSEIRVKTAAGTYAFDGDTGALRAAAAPGGRGLLLAPLVPCFWRAPTDNDSGGVEFMERWAAVLPALISIGVRILPALPPWLIWAIDNVTASLGLPPVSNNISYRTGWQREGWHRLVERPKGPPEVERDMAAGSVAITTASSLADPDAPSTERVRRRTRVEVLPTGEVWLTSVCDLRTLLPSIPRVGLSTRLGAAFAAAEWLGRGPHECYGDRKLSAVVARHAATVPELHTPYIVPSENGLRCDVRWVALRDKDGTGVLVVAAKDMQFSASHFRTSDLEAATHEHDLSPRSEVNLHIDHKHMGVGGDDSWSRVVYPEYLVPHGHYEWSICVKVLAAGEDADEAAQAALLRAPAAIKREVDHS
mmetsp:Transcript_1836/g.6038  ORF Transcript_1836/g.6038 Transcript_1836/m.6038 type:complete len:741 (+) Transcript_1836:680-2902(+)